MSRPDVFLGVAVALIVLGVVRLLLTADLVRRVLALNVAGSGVLLALGAVAARTEGTRPDPVPQALVLTGIVVAVSVTAVALGLVRRIEQDAVGGAVSEPAGPGTPEAGIPGEGNPEEDRPAAPDLPDRRRGGPQ